MAVPGRAHQPLERHHGRSTPDRVQWLSASRARGGRWARWDVMETWPGTSGHAASVPATRRSWARAAASRPVPSRLSRRRRHGRTPARHAGPWWLSGVPCRRNRCRWRRQRRPNTPAAGPAAGAVGGHGWDAVCLVCAREGCGLFAGSGRLCAVCGGRAALPRARHRRATDTRHHAHRHGPSVSRRAHEHSVWPCGHGLWLWGVGRGPRRPAPPRTAATPHLPTPVVSAAACARGRSHPLGSITPDITGRTPGIPFSRQRLALALSGGGDNQGVCDVTEACGLGRGGPEGVWVAAAATPRPGRPRPPPPAPRPSPPDAHLEVVDRV